LPAVDDVADQIEVIGFVVPQEIEQILRLATGRAEVNIGDPDAPIALSRLLLQSFASFLITARRIESTLHYGGITVS
jgi:hypothetical protein